MVRIFRCDCYIFVYYVKFSRIERNIQLIKAGNNVCSVLRIIVSFPMFRRNLKYEEVPRVNSQSKVSKEYTKVQIWEESPSGVSTISSFKFKYFLML